VFNEVNTTDGRWKSNGPPETFPYGWVNSRTPTEIIRSGGDSL